MAGRENRRGGYRRELERERAGGTEGERASEHVRERERGGGREKERERESKRESEGERV